MRTTDPRATSRGFTLLEVLAAVLVFAVIFTQLAAVASHGFRSEGESRRRLEASLIADAALASIEGSPLPEPGETVEERDLFTVTTVVAPLTLSDLGLDLEEGGKDSGDSERDDENESAPTSILYPEGDGESPLRRVDLFVTWDEGDREVQLTRTTFGMDRSSLESPFPPGEDPGSGGNPLEGSTGGEDQSQDDIIQEMLRQLGEAAP